MNANALKAKIDTFLEDKVAPLPVAHKAGIATVVILLPIVAFYFLLYAPKAEEITRLEGQKQSIEQQIQQLIAKTKNIEQFRKEKKEAEERFAAVSVLLPQQKEIPSLLTNISGLGTSSGLDFLSFRPKGEVAKDFYAEIPVDIQVKGQYHNVGLFFDKISKLPRIVTASNFSMGGPERQGSEMYLSTTFNLVTYRFLEQTQNDKKKGKK